MGDYETLRVEPNGHVTTVFLNRPDRLNAFTPQMWAELRTLGATLLDDPGDVRVLVVRGAGRAFSSGIDTSMFADGLDTSALRDPSNLRHDDPTMDAILATQDAFTWLAEAPFVTVAAVHGFAIGGGLQLALACDLRIVARGTTLSLPELTFGIVPDLGATQRLPRLVGPGKAIELVATAARIDADEGLRIGLVERVVDDVEFDSAVADLATAIAAHAPLALAGMKRAVHAALDGRSVREGLVVEAEAQALSLRSADFAEAMSAFAEGRTPRYTGR